MPTVPTTPGRSNSTPQPDPAYLLMAAGIMHQNNQQQQLDAPHKPSTKPKPAPQTGDVGDDFTEATEWRGKMIDPYRLSPKELKEFMKEGPDKSRKRQDRMPQGAPGATGFAPTGG